MKPDLTIDLKDDAVLVSLEMADAGYALKSYSHFFAGAESIETAVYVNRNGDEIIKRWSNGEELFEIEKIKRIMSLAEEQIPCPPEYTQVLIDNIEDILA
jgi:hypothetical protein